MMDDQEYRKMVNQFRGAGLLAATVLSIGTVFYHYTEKLNWLDSVYFSVISLATVGYGDIVPKTDAGKIFTIFYVLVGIGIIATFANLMLRRAVLRRERKVEAKKKN